MPLVDSGFRPPLFLRNGHLQTILPAFLRRRFDVPFIAERLELEDGDFLDLAWLRRGSGKLAILCHGLEGDTDAGYIRGMSKALARAGWDVLAWTFRGCSPLETNRLLRFYHSGETDDLRGVIRHAGGPYKQIVLAGFSLGGNIVLKYLGEQPPDQKIVGAVAVSVPVDLAASTRALDTHWGNRLYLRRFLKTLIAKVEAKAAQFPDQMDLHGIRQTRTFLEFDDRYTARIHGFRDAADYWRQSSSRQFLPRIDVPTLLLNAKDDPFLPPECFPVPEAEANPKLFLEMPSHGGHVGFVDWPAFQGSTWAERRAVEFFNERT